MGYGCGFKIDAMAENLTGEARLWCLRYPYSREVKIGAS